MPDSGLRRVAILSAIRIEYQAVRAYLTNFRQEIHPSGTIYERGNFTANSQSWDVLIGETGLGNTRAAVETISVIEYFKPSIILFVGVAGGLKDVKLSDVVAATKVYGYESGKAGRKFRPRPEVHSSTYRMVQRARAEARRGDWLQRLEESFPDPASAPQVYVAPIASGNQVAASMDSALGNLLRSNYGDAAAVEMEGYGFLEALHPYPNIDALIIRGISDLIDDKSDADANNLQEIAARHASAFAFEVLAKLGAPRFRRTRGRTKPPMVYKKQESGELNESAIETQSESLSDPTVNQKGIQDFLTSLSGYDTEIRDICHFFGERRITYPDQCAYAIQTLTHLNTAIKEHYIHITQSRSIKLKIDNIIYKIDDLIDALFELPHIHVSSQQDHQYISNQKQIREKFDSLLENLNQLVNEVNMVQQ